MAFSLRLSFEQDGTMEELEIKLQMLLYKTITLKEANLPVPYCLDLPNPCITAVAMTSFYIDLYH